MEGQNNDQIIAFALGGLAGNNAHGAGFLYGAARHGLQPRMISCTSGQIAWVYQYLKAQQSGTDLRELFQHDIEEMHQFHNINLDYARLAVTGKKGVFRPAFPEYPIDLAIDTLKAYGDVVRHQGNVFWLETFLRMFPGRVLVPTFEEELLAGISTTFNQTPIGIAFNSYCPGDGKERVYLNQAARDLLSPSRKSYKPGDKSHHRASTEYEAITPQAVLDGLWIYQYGFDKPESMFVDGAYYRQIMLAELTFANKIFAVRPVSRRWLGETSTTDGPPSEHPARADLPRSSIGIEDLKTEVNFNGSYIGERAQIALMNKLVRERDEYLAQHRRRDPSEIDLLAKYHHIDLLEVEIQIPRSFFDYVFESLEVFDAAVRELEKVLAEASARGLLSPAEVGR